MLKWLGLILATIGLFLILIGIKDNLSIGAGQNTLQIGALFFVGGFIIHLLNMIAERLNRVIIHLVDFEATLSMQVPLELAPESEKEEIPTQKKEVLKNSPFNLPIILPELPVEEKKNSPKFTLPEKKSSEKYDYFSERVMDEMPVTETFNPLIEEIKIKKEPIPAKKAVTESLKENNERLDSIARDFPELDAILRRDKTPEPLVQPAIIKEEPPTLPQASIIREGVISNIPFRLFSDGTIEADFVDGRHRFAGIAEFRAYAEGGA